MGRITWDALGERRFEIGVDRGVFYRFEGGLYIDGIAWNGLIGVDDDNGGRDATELYSGGVKVGTEYTAEEYGGKIRCYTYPDEFEPFLGASEIASGIYARQQARDLFSLCYRSRIGNDTEGIDHGYKLHLIYNMKVTDFSRSYSTINDSADVAETEIGFETFPQEVIDDIYDPMSEIVLDSRLIDPDVLSALEDILYGADDIPRMPLPDEIIEIITIPEEAPSEWTPYPNSMTEPEYSLYPQT